MNNGKNANKTPLDVLQEHGQSLWLDYISRQLLTSGKLKRMIDEDALTGMTSNPTIFQQAIDAATADGISVNITLLFSVERYDEVMEAYLKGLERRVEQGQPVGEIHSVASFFVSRVDTMVDKMLQQKIAAASDPERKRRLQ